MAIPTPPPDSSGGYIVITAQGAGQKHSMRFHVEPFTLNDVGAYSTVVAGREASVQETAGNLMAYLAGQFSTSTTLSLTGVFNNVAGTLTEYFGVVAPGAVAGTLVAAPGMPEEYLAFNFRTQGGGRARFFAFGTPGWAYGAPVVEAASDANPTTKLVKYLTGGVPAGGLAGTSTNTTRIVGHDGTVLVSPAHVTLGINKRIRRRAGDA